MSLFKSPTDYTDLHRFILAIIVRKIPQISKQKKLRHLRNLRAFFPKAEQVQNLCKSVKSVGQNPHTKKNLRHQRNLRDKKQQEYI